MPRDLHERELGERRELARERAAPDDALGPVAGPLAKLAVGGDKNVRLVELGRPAGDPVVSGLLSGTDDLDPFDGSGRRPVEDRHRLDSLAPGPLSEQLDEALRREVRPQRAPHVRGVDEHEHVRCGP